ncbi:MAG: hypothetical protein H6817_04495 [Phycisphaerales bacterium]|nr:hypothetical protein [Phycisphaerales bacterium]
MMCSTVLPDSREPWQVLMAFGERGTPQPWTAEMDRLLDVRQVRFSQAAGDRQTVECIESGGVDLALLCGDRGGFDGLRTLEVIRAKFDDLPVLLVTHDASTLTLRRALALRAQSVIPQPVDAPLLADTMMRILRKRFSQ